MIARIILPLLIVIALTFGYFYKTHRWYKRRWWWQLVAFLIACLVAWRLIQATLWRDYFPDTTAELVSIIHIIVVCVALPATVALGGLAGMAFRHRRRGEATGLALGVAGLLLYLYGMAFGSKSLEVRHVEYESEDLPAAFDGYRIVQVSDLHLGTFTGSRTELLRRAVDSINAQQPDLVVVTGDLQNKQPSEIEPHMPLLATIHARDGVFSVLGNHDYAEYIDQTDAHRVSGNLGLTRSLQQDMGWTLLCNTRRRIVRDSAHIVIAGMENDGEGRFPQRGNIQGTLYGLNPKERDFVVMLEHDPTAWRRKILPHSHAQLTLSGHTHGGQLSILGWSPASLVYPENCGLYHCGPRALYVSKGLGGVIPFRLGAAPEVVVITLRCKNK